MRVFSSPKGPLVALVGAVVLALSVLLAAILTRPLPEGQTMLPGTDVPGGITQADADGQSPRRITNRFGMEFVEIPAGRFVMGSIRGKADEQPHIVHITRPFLLGVTEVTSRHEILIGIAGGELNREEYGVPNSENQVSTSIASWQEATHLATTLSTLDPEYDYRLPTEAEWEYACRSKVDSIEPAENDAEVSQPHRKGHGAIDLVKLELPNAFGLYDMLRNNGEFCSDWYAADYYDHSPLEDPKGPPMGRTKVARGVGSRYSAWRRYHARPGGDGNILIGVRFVLEKEEVE